MLERGRGRRSRQGRAAHRDRHWAARPPDRPHHAHPERAERARHAAWLLRCKPWPQAARTGRTSLSAAVAEDDGRRSCPSSRWTSPTGRVRPNRARRAGPPAGRRRSRQSARQHSELNPSVRSAGCRRRPRGRHPESRRQLLADAVALFEARAGPLALAAALEDLGATAVDDGPLRWPWTPSAGRWKSTRMRGPARNRRVRGLLRALGVRRGLVAERHPGIGWAALTDSELAVARLVVEV